MISAVDSSVLLDVLVADPVHGAESEALLRRASAEGRLVICECVVAEVLPALGSAARMTEFMSELQIDFIPSDRDSALLAGERFALYLKRGGKAGRVAADFLIGAHAMKHADRLLARDRGYLRDYFKGLVMLSA